MEEEKLQNHREAFKLIEKDIYFTQANEVVVQDKDDE
jgi:hypothetical protein